MKNSTPKGSLRIIGGKWRSRKIEFPAVEDLRPTANRIRETLFNWLQEVVPSAHCLDLFAGSGACGLEALSRGAAHVTFVEYNRKAADALEANLARLGETRMPVICTDALKWLQQGTKQSAGKFRIVFLDPPYRGELESATCHALENSGVLQDHALIYLETNRDLADELFPPGWRIVKRKRAGSVNYLLLERRAENSGKV